jgi:hypothetical protein
VYLNELVPPVVPFDWHMGHLQPLVTTVLIPASVSLIVSVSSIPHISEIVWFLDRFTFWVLNLKNWSYISLLGILRSYVIEVGPEFGTRREIESN